MSTANIVFLLVLVLAVVAIVVWIATVASRAKRMSAASDARLASALAEIANNPPVAKPFDEESPAERSAQVIAMAEDDDESPAQIAQKSKEERLTELSALHAKGAISDDELAAARAKILAE